MLQGSNLTKLEFKSSLYRASWYSINFLFNYNIFLLHTVYVLRTWEKKDYERIQAITKKWEDRLYHWINPLSRVRVPTRSQYRYSAYRISDLRWSDYLSHSLYPFPLKLPSPPVTLKKWNNITSRASYYPKSALNPVNYKILSSTNRSLRNDNRDKFSELPFTNKK